MHIGHDHREGGGAGGGGARVRVVRRALEANDRVALANRSAFAEAGAAVVNFMSAPGAGKTALLERLAERVRGRLRLGVLEGDVQGRFDAERLECLGVPVAQINTDTGFGGECHLEARMVAAGLPQLPLAELDLLIVENVGNLVCPAEFDVGEDARVMVCSVTEGEDKPLKYPLMFRASDLVLVNKIDLLAHLDFDLDRLLKGVEAVHPGVPCLPVSARTGEGVGAWLDWLETHLLRPRAAGGAA